MISYKLLQSTLLTSTSKTPVFILLTINSCHINNHFHQTSQATYLMTGFSSPKVIILADICWNYLKM